MKKLVDKNGNPLKGAAIWLKRISLDGGLEEHDKKIEKKIKGVRPLFIKPITKF